MRNFLILFILTSLSTFGQQADDLIYRKLALNSCRCMNSPDVFFVSEDQIKQCDLKAYQSLTEAEKKQVSFDNSSQEAYMAFSLKILPHRKDYCPQVVNFFENKKKEELFAEQQRMQKERRQIEVQERLANEQMQVEVAKSAEQARIAELERLLQESRNTKQVDVDDKPEKESKKERKAREKREKLNLKKIDQTAEVDKESTVMDAKPTKIEVVKEVATTNAPQSTKIEEAVYDPVNNKLVKNSEIYSDEMKVSDKQVKATNSDDVTIIGTLEEFKSSQFNTIVVKDQSGQLIEMIWLNKFVGAELFIEGKVPVGTKVKAIYKDFEFYHGRAKEYRKFKVIRGFMLE